MALLSGRVGRSMAICRSNLPGLSRAWSNTSTRFVEAKMTTLSSELIPGENEGGGGGGGGSKFTPVCVYCVVCSPSISTSSWLRVLSCSWWPSAALQGHSQSHEGSSERHTHPPLRDRPTASSSSMYTMQGAESRACRNRSLTRALPTPDWEHVCMVHAMH